MDDKQARYRREKALARAELREPTQPRVSVGVTSAPIKIEDPAVRSMVDDFLARRGEAR